MSAPEAPRRIRCAIYTRKSSEEGLEQEFNSLDAQREACEAYIASQRHEGWRAMREGYDDGGYSGGNLDRPGLQNLLEDIRDGLVDVIVVYKIDRLSRSLMDFARLVEVFDEHKVTFVSVTQSFNTTTSMGRLTLNVLLSFAQFEREVTGERIRDKIAASRAKGMWMGGFVPWGYDAINRKLVINEAEAAQIRFIFERFVELGSATRLTRELVRKGITNKRGRPIDKGFLYKLFRNRVYLGEAVHKGTCHPGEHQAIIDQALWDKVHSILTISPRTRANNTRSQTPAMLKGLIFTDTGTAMTPTHTRKGERLYRYYISMDALRNRGDEGQDSIVRLNAGVIESAVVQKIRQMLRTPEIAAKACAGLRAEGSHLDEQDVSRALATFDNLWDNLFPAEQERTARLLINRVVVSKEGMSLDLRTSGLSTLVSDMLQSPNLTQRGLIEFCKFFLDRSVDQVRFMSGLLEPTTLLPRMEIHIEEEVRAKRLLRGSFAVLREAVMNGEVERAKIPSLTGYEERGARNVTSGLVERGMLTASSHRAPLRLAFPADVAERWFPNLYPANAGSRHDR